MKSKAILIPFQAEHLQLIEKRPEIYPPDLAFMLSMAPVYAQYPSATMIIDNHIVCCGGIISLWPYMGEAWLITSPDIIQYKSTLSGMVHNFIKMTVQVLKLRRLQTVVQGDFAAAHRFIKHLGFKPQCPMVNYFGDQTYILYAMIMEE